MAKLPQDVINQISNHPEGLSSMVVLKYVKGKDGKIRIQNITVDFNEETGDYQWSTSSRSV